LDKDLLHVTYDAQEVDPAKLLSTIQEQGFKAETR